MRHSRKLKRMAAHLKLLRYVHNNYLGVGSSESDMGRPGHLNIWTVHYGAGTITFHSKKELVRHIDRTKANIARVIKSKN